MTTVHTTARVTEAAIDRNGFVAKANLPGLLLPGHADHGLGALAAIMESFMAPGTHIPLHEHVQDEIVSWVPAGVMRHDDPQGGHLVIDADHLMVMNAGRSFRHEERTRADDPPLRMLQIFVRPYAADLEPGIQFGPLPSAPRNAWRSVFGPVGGDAPFHVRNAVECRDLRLDAQARVALPARPGWMRYLYVFTGRVALGDATLGEGETALVAEDGRIGLTGIEDALVVAFAVDPRAEMCRAGSVGDGETVRAAAARMRA